jgi:S-adenosylmethionine hydrolase
VSHIFHGRDVFAAVAGHISAGVEINDLGDEIYDPILLDIPEPEIKKNTIKGIVLRADHFGNLETNIDQGFINKKENLSVYVKDHEIKGLVNTFGDSEKGDLVSMIDSSGQLSICIVNGSAKEFLGADFGTAVEVRVRD